MNSASSEKPRVISVIIPSYNQLEGLKKTVKWYFENEQWLTNVTSGEYQTYYQTLYKEKT